MIPLAAPLTDAGNTQLVIAALLGIAAVVLLITLAKLHPFIALMLGAAVMGGVAAVAPLDIVASFTAGFGSTMGTVGILIALGAMVGKLLLQPRQRRRLLAGQGVLRAHDRPDHQVLVGDGDGDLGRRSRVRVAAQPGGLTR